MLVFMLMPTPNFGAMSAKQHPCLQAEKQVGIAPGIQSELRKIGFFKKISKIKQIKKSLKKRLTMEREKAGALLIPGFDRVGHSEFCSCHVYSHHFSDSFFSISCEHCPIFYRLVWR
jgi:hypothetical protein